MDTSNPITSNDTKRQAEHQTRQSVVTAIPAIPLDRLRAHACIDYVTFAAPNYRELERVQCPANWSGDGHGPCDRLTLHDPRAEDILQVVERMGDLPVMGLEVAVDFWPQQNVSAAERAPLLRESFVALSARFRPEEGAMWGLGLRAAFNDKKPKPFHKRLPSPEESLVYGHRGDWQSAKLYLKTLDRKRTLPPEEHRLRMELTFQRWALFELHLSNASHLFSFPYRSALSGMFRVVDHPVLRGDRRRSPQRTKELEEALLRHWRAAGVGGLGLKHIPLETGELAKRALAKRAREQMPMKHVRLVRCARTSGAVQNALRQLERRMRRFSGGSFEPHVQLSP